MTKSARVPLTPITAVGSGLALLLLTPTVAAAVPRLDLSGYPAPAPGLQRWVIQPAGLLPKSSDPIISARPIDWRIQLIVGQEVDQDCNVHRLSGPGMTMRMLPEASGKALFEVKGPMAVVSTRMACCGRTHKAFLPVVGQAALSGSLNASWPIVWTCPRVPSCVALKAETRQQEAVKL